jgi:hypothetical protein
MRDPEPVELIAAATPVFIAQAVVGVAVVLGAAVTIQGHALWTVILGMTP